MFYFGRIISAFFNQLFRFLLWNKFGQKLLIILIISLIAFWCVGMTKVHAVEEVEDINYEVQSYYDSVVNDAIIRIYRYITTAENGEVLKNWVTSDNIYYFYYNNISGSSYNNARPLSSRYLNIVRFGRGGIGNFSATSNDYLGVTDATMYYRDNTNLSGYRFDTGNLSNFTTNELYIPQFVFTYTNENWSIFIQSLLNNDNATIVGLLEDIKEEQQATNDFLNEETDTSNMVIDTPSVTDTASDNMSNNLHDQINTLTTNLQSTVANYYEGQDAYTWRIPLPSYIGGDIRFDSGVTRRIIGTSGVVYNIIQAIWVVLFGGYIVGFIKRMLDWVQTGKIFDEGGIADFIWWMDTNNEIIKASMM